MVRRLRDIFIGLSLVILIFGMLFAISSVTQAENNKPTIPTAELSQVYRQALLSPLLKASSEAKDPGISQFSQKLIQSYELDKPSNTEATSLADLLPDIKKINKTALDMTLKEAGKNIKDAELAEFYNGFITRIGVGK